jgi:co-chaperonin GroES (HSP10)
MNFTPTGNKVLCEWINFHADSKLAMPESMETPDHAAYRVIAIGEGLRLDDGSLVPITNVKVGDEVVAHPGAAVKIEPRSIYGGRRMIVVPADALLLKVDRDPSDMVSSPKILTPGAKDLKLVQ